MTDTVPDAPEKTRIETITGWYQLPDDAHSSTMVHFKTGVKCATGFKNAQAGDEILLWQGATDSEGKRLIPKTNVHAEPPTKAAFLIEAFHNGDLFAERFALDLEDAIARLETLMGELITVGADEIPPYDPRHTRSRDGPDTASTSIGSPQLAEDPYYEDVTDLCTAFQTRHEQLRQKRQALIELDSRVSKIDCDLGGANLTISDNIITVTTSTPDMAPEMRSLLNDYSWPRQFDIGYDTRSGCIQWTLETDLATLVDDHT